MYILTILYFTGDNIAALHKICGNIMQSKFTVVYCYANFSEARSKIDLVM